MTWKKFSLILTLPPSPFIFRMERWLKRKWLDSKRMLQNLIFRVANRLSLLPGEEFIDLQRIPHQRQTSIGYNMFHGFSLTYSPPKVVFCEPPPPSLSPSTSMARSKVSWPMYRAACFLHIFSYFLNISSYLLLTPTTSPLRWTNWKENTALPAQRYN